MPVPYFLPLRFNFLGAALSHESLGGVGRRARQDGAGKIPALQINAQEPAGTPALRKAPAGSQRYHMNSKTTATSSARKAAGTWATATALEQVDVEEGETVL